MSKPEEEQAQADTASINETDKTPAVDVDTDAGLEKKRKRAKPDAATPKKTDDPQTRKKTPAKKGEKKEGKIDEKKESRAPGGKEEIEEEIKEGKENEKKEEKEEGELIVRFSIEVSKEEIEKNFEETAAKYSSEIKLPGFRTGKVPVEVVKNRFKEAIIEEVKEKVIAQAVDDRIKKDKMQPASSPVIEKLDHKEGENLRADIKVEVYPEIPLPDFETIEITTPAKDIRLAEYDEQKNIDAFLEANRRTTPVTGREIRENDAVKLKYQSKLLDTKRMTPRKETIYLVKQETLAEISDLYPELIGKKQADQVTVRRKYPPDYHKKIWAGKDVEHYVEIVDIYELVKPNLDNEFLQSQGFADENSFREHLKEDYLQYEKNYRENKIDQLISDRIVEVIHFPVPRALIEEEAASMALQAGREINIDSEQELREIMSPFMAKAEKKIRVSLIVNAVRENFKLEISADELEQEYGKIAGKNRLPIKEVRKYYLNSKQDLQRLKEYLLIVKTMGLLKEKIKIKEV